MIIESLGPPTFPSPLGRAVDERVRIPACITCSPESPAAAGPSFELAGPRARLFFDAPRTRAGIVTCGGLCPGLNNVIRSLFHELMHAYGVPEIVGFRYGYHGLDPAGGLDPIRLTADFVDPIHKRGGSVLGTSRGPVSPAVALDTLARWRIDMLFCIGGDGTQRGAYELHEEAERRRYPLAVVGIPKTIDNDVAFVDRTFGYLTAVEAAREIIDSAHMEARSVQNGVSLVKVMGRNAGFIAAGATIASQDVNFTLLPEVPFALEGPRGFLAGLQHRIERRQHAVVVVAEGAGQELMTARENGRDASGNQTLQDIGVFLRDRIADHFKAAGMPIVLRYFDPSYLIRSRPANCEDAILCDHFARNAAHAAMAGKTGLVIGNLHDVFVHVPSEALVKQKKRLDPRGGLWHAVLAATGQPARFE
jgi:6-phosphofructokinase 1